MRTMITITTYNGSPPLSTLCRNSSKISIALFLILFYSVSTFLCSLTGFSLGLTGISQSITLHFHFYVYICFKAAHFLFLSGSALCSGYNSISGNKVKYIQWRKLCKKKSIL